MACAWHRRGGVGLRGMQVRSSILIESLRSGSGPFPASRAVTAPDAATSFLLGTGDPKLGQGAVAGKRQQRVGTASLERVETFKQLGGSGLGPARQQQAEHRIPEPFFV